jgi:ABC-2 type transport system permease protein
VTIDRVRIREMLLKELRQMFRDPRVKRVVFVAPILQLLAFGYAVNTDIRNTRTFIVDRDRTSVSRELVDAFTSTGYFSVVGRSDDSSDLVRALDRGRAVVGIEIPAGLARDLNAGQGARVQLVLDGTESNTATVAMGYSGQIIQHFARSRRPAGSIGGADVRVRAWYNPQLESRVYNVPGVIGMLILLMSLLLTALSVVREREMGTLDQLAVSPLTATELMLGKTLPPMMVAVVDLCLITALAVLWFHIPMRGSFFVLLAAAILFIVAGLSVGLLISTISRTQQEAFMSLFLFLLPTIILSGFFYPVNSMPRGFQYLTYLNPLRFFLEAVRGIFIKGAGFTDLWRQFLMLAIMAAAALSLAVVRFRRTAVS